ncbi:hypothetical protein AwPolaro_03810 [Polaromonas sp.]|nr:hypothetical protein AwPolaro_03810 [Polaromonas sp.]
MCLIAFAINASARWPLVIASNRDEFLARPTQPLAVWTSESGQRIVSGQDLRAGGTWLGATPAGRVAFVTNVRQAQTPAAARSRGELVTRWLASSLDGARFGAELAADSAAYGGFNLVFGDFQRQQWTWASNQSAAGCGWQTQTLRPGIYGLSNAQLDTPWPKTIELKRALTMALSTVPTNTDSGEQLLQRHLWAALANPQRDPEALEDALSSAFVSSPEHAYGTRSSTLLLASAAQLRDGAQYCNVSIEEKTYNYNTAPPTLQQHSLCWQQIS